MECITRWIQTLRSKAQEYEHPARSKGESVTGPSLDSLCWEMEAFQEALKVKK